MKLCLPAFAALILIASSANATHLRSADIIVEPACEGSLTFKITVLAYLNTGTNTRFGTNSEVRFGDGSSVRIPISNSIPRPDLGTHIAVATFSTTHTYSSHGSYTITYLERDRSTGVLNIANSHDVPYVTFVTIHTSLETYCNTYPVLAVPPIDRACLGVTFYHAAGAYDVDGDSLSYELAVPASGISTLAAYTAPTASRFYADPAHANEAKTGPATFHINSLSGLMTWDAPGMVGEYNVAFNIKEWRKNSQTGAYFPLSVTTRDMQIIVEECQNIRPDLLVPADTCIIAGTAIEKVVRGTDQDNHPVKIEVFSELVDLPAGLGPATYSPVTPQFAPSDPPAEVSFSWASQCAHVRQQPYQVVFKITDSPPDGPKLVNFKVWNIRVVAPAPAWTEANVDLVQRSAVLRWEEYSCKNANAMQVWRKVGSFSSAVENCEIRSPGYWGYQLIGEVPIAQNEYVDSSFGKGLSVGALYCYRLVARIGDTRSWISKEACVGPIRADAPVITHASVEKTAVDGAVRVSWRKPFNIDRTQFPEPYEYEIYRAQGLFGAEGMAKAGRVSDTTFLDTGIDSEENVFNYRIVLYGKPMGSPAIVPVDTSAEASTVRLTAVAGKKRIELTWRDSVAWSNVVETRPYHLIYRAAGSRSVSDMILVDSVDVTHSGFTYVDVGKYKGMPLAEDEIYSYRIVTRGTYGNPRIALQENFSQVASLHPENDLLPCKPVLSLHLIDCDQYVASNTCDEVEFTNRLFWRAGDVGGCRKDIKAYNLYSSANRDGEYELIAAKLLDTVYTDAGLPSYARCYRVSAIDASGREGPLSDSVCNNNCPYYRLPNVFTPNADGVNDSFSTNFQTGEVETNIIPCPRFVNEITFRVYNRWGRQVYVHSSGTGDPSVIDWDGRDEDGTELAAGVYFFTAEVAFNVLDVEEQNKTLKGWIHLLR